MKRVRHLKTSTHRRVVIACEPLVGQCRTSRGTIVHVGCDKRRSHILSRCMHHMHRRASMCVSVFWEQTSVP